LIDEPETRVDFLSNDVLPECISDIPDKLAGGLSRTAAGSVVLRPVKWFMSIRYEVELALKSLALVILNINRTNKDARFLQIRRGA
jgi:hypothetical protein